MPTVKDNSSIQGSQASSVSPEATVLKPPIRRTALAALVAGLGLMVGWQAWLWNEPQPHVASPGGASRDSDFTAAFEQEVKKVGQITPDQFAQRFPGQGQYGGKLSWDPTTARHWDRFNLDPNDPNTGVRIRNVGLQQASNLYDFRLNERESAVFKEQGFVVSERLGSHSFTDFYYRIYVRDLPVFITTDSLLHAWHRYFDRLLEDLEGSYFRPEFKHMLGTMAAQISAAQEAYGKGPASDALADVDFFLAVARQLLEPGGSQSALGQEERVQQAIQACNAGQMVQYPLFGRERTIDFSQFKPRGRYDQSEESKKYFRAVMWLGRVDFRLAGGETPDQDVRELAGAAVLHDLLQRAGMAERWQQLDRVLTQLMGKSDALNFSQLGAVLAGSEIVAPARLTRGGLVGLRNRILDSNIGEQHIRGEWFEPDPFQVDPRLPPKFVLPRTFAFLGQRFVLDSWALSKVVYDDVLWDGEKVPRRIPSCLDVAFAVFGNDHVTPLLTQRLKDPAGRRFRDGLPYQHNLTAVRQVIDRLPEETWKESAVADWLGCLRELSKPTTGAEYPEAVRTSAWALKSTATQLASWTQMRHDTILYAKPSYSSGDKCSYPAGFVEPVPHFWRRFEQMVRRTKVMLDKTTFPDAYHSGGGRQVKERHLKRAERFVHACGMLRAISEKELVQKELSSEETKFLQDVVVRNGMSGAPPVSGWYPNLYSRRSDYRAQDDAHKWVALVTDVHTDPPDLIFGDPGCVLHQAVGNVDGLIIAIDNGKDRMVYAGPVFSHYELETPNAVRLTNGDWHDQLRADKNPSRPEWTKSFVVPGVNPEAKKYGKEGLNR